MAENHQGFLKSIKGKIIIASVLACFALLLAWGISKTAFERILNAVENISAPNDRLRLVNKLSREVTQLDQQQKLQILHNTAKYNSFTIETGKLNLAIDTLTSLYAGDNVQLKRIGSLKKLLADRDRLFISYSKVREGLVNNRSFNLQVQALNNLVNEGAKQNDSTVTTTEKKTSTTTVYPSEEKDSRGFFSKLFGKKKTSDTSGKPYQVVNEELNVKHDTLAKAIMDSIVLRLNETVAAMEKAQRRKSALFVNRETILANANDKLISQIITILKQVETETVAQVEMNNSAAKNVVNTGIRRISIIMLVFFLITVVLLYFILTDISHSNRYRKALEEARDEAEYHGRAKQRFLSNMSHEIRTPLQSIIGYAELIRRQQYPDQKNIEAIYHSSGHLMQIVNEVLDYNRIISGKFTFLNQTFNMTGLLNEVVSVLNFQAEKKSLSLVSDYELPETDQVEGDPFRLKQVLYNLLGNAIKFTDAGQVKLTVTCSRHTENLKYIFTITDTGIGLSEKDISHIFNEFEQVESQTSTHLAGTGLGLTISKSLIESQGGSITVKSKPGKGSSFTFSLSFKKAEVVEAFEKNTGLAEIAKPAKVWIIDDDTFILDICSSMLKNNSIPHACFNAPDDVLAAEWDDAVKYILIDIRMPGMSGIELCKLLRQRVPADVKIYALTAQALPDEREMVLSQGFNGLLMKPFKEQDLVDIFNSKNPDMTEDTAPEVDISKLENMAFGDKDQLNKILVRFTEDSEADIETLKAGMKNSDIEKTMLLIHRIAGRTAQIGAGELATGFRLAEMKLQADRKLSHNQMKHILLLTIKLQELVKQINARYLYSEAV